MTAADALKVAVFLARRAQDMADLGETQVSTQLANGAAAWALISMAIESGVPSPDMPPTSPAAETGTG